MGKPGKLGKPGNLGKINKPGKLGKLGKPARLGELGKQNEISYFMVVLQPAWSFFNQRVTICGA